MSINIDTRYLDLVERILVSGEERKDRTGVGTLSLFGEQIRCDLSEGFPMLTTKKVAFKPVVGELLWFIEGSGDERRLAEITYGTRDPARTTIWTANAQADYWKPKANFDGDLGRVYGVQWRHWQTNEIYTYEDGQIAGAHIAETDQLSNIINTLKTNPYDRRMMLTAFNPGELDDMALPPCHLFCQFYVNFPLNQKPRLSCKMYMRSCDVGLGLPFNIASYGLLTHLIAQVVGYDVGELIISFGDVHVYLNHIDALKEQLKRTTFELPTLKLNPGITDIDGFTMNDIELINYVSHPTIKMDMAV
jgi:thymidylate synthase